MVSIGDDRFPVIDAQYPGANGATDFIVMRHLPDKSIYTIVCKNVTPCDSNREGTLYISVAVPAKEHVEGLFNMLIELQNAYKSSCMSYDGTWYHFQDRPENPQIFADILSRHKIDRYPYRTVITSEDTSSIAYLYLTTEQISDILNDPMRGEFSRFGQIVLVPVTDPAAYTSTINVPAKIWRSYKIYVNGRQTGQTLSDPNKTVTITLPETGSHESASTTFSISQARETRMPGIAVDDEAQIIYLNLQPKPKPKPVIPRTSSIDTAIAEANRKKKNKLYAIIAGCAVIVIAALVYFLCFSSKDDKNEAPAKTSTQTDSNSSSSSDNEQSTGNDSGSNLQWGEEGDESGENSSDDNDDPSLSDDTSLLSDKEVDKEAKDDIRSNSQQSHERLKNDLERDKALLTSDKITFRQINKIKQFKTNYLEIEGYEDFNKIYEYIVDVEEYLLNLNENTSTLDYKKKINEFIKRGEDLKLDYLVSMLKKRIEGDPTQIKETMKNKSNF